MHFETKAIHAGAEPDESTGSLSPALHLSTTYERDRSGSPTHGYSYIRDGNPTQSRLEEALAAIDSGDAALAFASAMAAASCLLQSLDPGSHVVFPDDSYYAIRTMARDFFPRWNLSFDFAAAEDAGAVSRVVRRETKMIWAETPSNPLMKISDLKAIAEIAHGTGALLVVDGTFATPALQRPIEMGADVVLHSTTKYLGGHSDVQGGSATFRRRDAFFEGVAHARTITGAVASPFNSWLVLRGIRSLGARMRVHCENARAISTFLASHPRVEAVHYPGLPAHPHHEVAKHQMSDFGGMLSFAVKGGREGALAVTARVRVFTRATSLGGVESLIEHRASSEGEGSRTPQNLLRVSAGLEHAEDLVEDLRQALS